MEAMNRINFLLEWKNATELTIGTLETNTKEKNKIFLSSKASFPKTTYSLFHFT